MPLVMQMVSEKRNERMDRGYPSPARLLLGERLDGDLLRELKGLVTEKTFPGIDEVETCEGFTLLGMKIEVIPLVDGGMFLAVE